MRAGASSMQPMGLDGTVARIARALPAVMSSRGTLDDLAQVAAQLPAAIAGRLYFETPLGSDAPRVDLIVGVERDSQAALMPVALARLAAPRAHHAWSRLSALAACLTAPDSPLHDARDTVWLEFDIEPAATRRADCPPGVFVDFDDSIARRDPAADALGLATMALAPLLDHGALQQSRDALARCVDRLPNGAALASVGALVPRDGVTIRLCISGVSPVALPDYLRAIAWPGSLAALVRLTHSVVPADDASFAAHPLPGLVHLDLSTTVLPRVGIEYRFRRGAQLRGRVAETAFLRRLVRLGLCTRRKRDAMLTWPGHAGASMPHELWESVVLRRLNHVKVTYAEGCPTVAKGYLCATHVPRIERRRLASVVSDERPASIGSRATTLPQMHSSTQ